MDGPPKLSELVFSEGANHKFSRILGDLKRANLSITHRLQSIVDDAAFVDDVAAALGRPLVANERCGSWYIRPEGGRKAASAYFKSTDGHTGQWRFSPRRLNLHLLYLIGMHDGCIIVDSTRRGKSMPDALSKTVPIWCCVLNRTLFPEDTACHELYLPPTVVGASEHGQIGARILEFVDLLRSLNLNLRPFREALKKPLRPHWVTQETRFVSETTEIFRDFHPVICCTSSRRVEGAEMSEGGYIQGAGDDTENWALGLTPPLFWAHADELLTSPEPKLPSLIEDLVAKARASSENLVQQAIPIGPQISVAKLPLPPESLVPGQCQIVLTTEVTKPETWFITHSRLEVGLGKQRAARRNLRLALGSISTFAYRYLQGSEENRDSRTPRSVLIACETGKDLSVGAALAVDCWCFGEDGRFRTEEGSRQFTKTTIRARLGRIMTAMPDANPSRPTLQSVNSFLMEAP